jgi:hypothetical protein
MLISRVSGDLARRWSARLAACATCAPDLDYALYVFEEGRPEVGALLNAPGRDSEKSPQGLVQRQIAGARRAEQRQEHSCCDDAAF